MSIGGPFRALGTAIRTLTILPCPGREAASLASALPWFPCVGLLIGAGLVFIGWVIGGLVDWPLGAAAVAVAWMAWVTGGLHLDGLADTVDGLAGGRTRERALEIMKDSRVGALGAIALAVVLLLKVIAVARLVELQTWRWLPVPVILARLAQVQLSVALPYARAEGGTASAFVRESGLGAYAVAAISAMVLCALLADFAGIAAWLAATGVAVVIGAGMRRRLGGVTGDVLGYASEMTEALLFIAFAIAASAWHARRW